MGDFLEPIDMLCTNDDANLCPFDGSRTELLEQRDEYTVEVCPCCKRLFNFWNS